MQANQKPTILFETEGSYPYATGGVSTWADILCRELKDKTNFIFLALTGSPNVRSHYKLPSNIRSVIHVPLWGVEEPSCYINRKEPFSKHVLKKFKTDDKVIKNIFLPMFRDFVDRLLDPFQPPQEFGELIYGLWKYYQHFDYKTTITNPLLWDEFKQRVQRNLSSEKEQLRNEEPHALDITFGKRWIYHFMMPLAVSIPKVSATHSSLAGFPAIASIAAKFEYGTPMIVTDHGIFIRERLLNVSQSDMTYFSKRLLINMSTFITRAVYHFADLISPVTSVNIKWEQQFEGEKQRIHPIYNGVDTKAFQPQPKPAHTKERPTVVAAAHLFPLKDIETMIRSCGYARRVIPEVQFILYGRTDIDKAYTRKCKRLVETLGLEKSFIFGGYHQNPAALFNEGDISILSSVSEGFPYTVIESMSCARPVVATDVGGVSEAIEDCGIICRPRNAKGLAEGVIKFIKNDGYRFEMGQKSRERVLEHYTILKSVNSYHKMYDKFHRQRHQPMSDTVQIESVKNFLKQL